MLSCPVRCNSDGYNDIEEYEIRTARVEHECGECHKTIHKGQKYEYATICAYGEFDHFKTCIPCMNARKDHLECWTFGDVWEDIYEIYGYDDCIITKLEAAK